MSGEVRQGKTVYRYDADFLESQQCWYGYVTSKTDKVVYTTPAANSYQAAIQAAKEWIRARLDRR